MKQLPDIKFRLISGFSIAGLLFAAVFLLPDAGIPVVLALLGVVLSLEFYKLESAAGIPNFNVLGTLATVALVAVAWWTGVRDPATAGTWDAVVLFLTTIAVLLRQFPQKNNPHPIQTIAGTLLGVLYIGLLWSCLAKLLVFGRPSAAEASIWTVSGLHLPGRWLLLYSLFVAKFTDIGAYLVGCAFGRHKLIPRISPGKSWEGVVGGIAIGTLVGCIVVHFVPAANYAPYGLTVPRAIPLGICLAVCTVVGDLTESLFKRASGLKDSASAIPGMGGLLDVVDSILFAAPAFYLYLRLAAALGWTPAA